MLHLFGTLILAATTAVQGAAIQGQNIPPTCNRTATVQSGDTCFKISASNNVSTYQLAFVNQDIIDPNCDNLHAGSVLCLGIKGQDCYDTFTVPPSYNCPAIASVNNISQSTLEANNPGQCTGPRPLEGETMCVSSTIYNYTTHA